MEAHAIGHENVWPILKKIQELKVERNKNIGSDMYMIIDKKIDVLLEQLYKLFQETTPIFHNKFESESGEIDTSNDVEVSDGPNHFDLSTALSVAVPDSTNLTEVTTPVEREEERKSREAKEQVQFDELIERLNKIK